MSLNRSLVWHRHSDSEEPPSERKSFSGCDDYQIGMEDGGMIEEEQDELGKVGALMSEPETVSLC